MQIKESKLPDVTQPQFPIPEGLSHHLPEYWFSVYDGQKERLLKTLEDIGLEYKVFDLEDTASKECRIVARFIDQRSADTATNMLDFICQQVGIEGYVISDGSLTSVGRDGDILGFVSFD